MIQGMLSISDKYDSVNECTQEISELMKLHIQRVWQNGHKFMNNDIKQEEERLLLPARMV